MSTHAAERMLDPRNKYFPSLLKAPFTLDQRRKLALGEEITLHPKDLKRKKKNSHIHVIFITREQDRHIQNSIRENKPFKLQFSPLAREFNARFATGFFGDVWDGVKKAASTVYKGAQKVAKSQFGQALLKGVDLLAATEGVPPGLISGGTNLLLGVDPNEPEEEEAVDEEDLPDDIQQSIRDYNPPRTYSFPEPPTAPRPRATAPPARATAPPVPPLPTSYPKSYNFPPPPPPLPKAHKSGGMIAKRRLGVTSQLIPFSSSTGGSVPLDLSMFKEMRASGLFDAIREKISGNKRLDPKDIDWSKVNMMSHPSSTSTSGSGMGMAGVRMINTSRGPRYHDGRRFISREKYMSMMKKGSGVLLPGAMSY